MDEIVLLENVEEINQQGTLFQNGSSNAKFTTFQRYLPDEFQLQSVKL
jgi:hypothetical protein